MFTRCPKCHAVFRVSANQLEARGGMVRCGHCQSPFRADQNQVPEPPATSVPSAATAKVPGVKKKKRKRRASTASMPVRTSFDLPLDLPMARPRVPAGVWAIGAILALVVLAGQLSYLYRQEIARVPELAPAIENFCALIGCEVRPAQDVRRIELLDRTRIAPHPRYQNVLRIRVVMVNRASFPQPYPVMEVSLTDSNGALLARRHFAASQYLAEPRPKDVNMTPEVVVNALLDVTNPDDRASGYEIRLLPAP